jgi:hypothetical protein
MGRFARNIMARASGGSVALSRLWPGRSDRLIIAPHDLRTADATRAAEIYAGRFVFAGKIVTCHGRSIFDLEPPSEDWEVALLGFGWLRHLRAADTALTRANARSLVDDWMSNPTRKRPLERRADVLARRVISLLSQAPLVLSDTDGKFYRRYLRGLTREIRFLRYAMLDLPDGVPRLQVLIALCYASLCLANQARHIRSASRKLSHELLRQILPDGGHISRNPGALVISEVKCSQRLYDDIASHGGKPIMWKAGHSLLKAKMKETGALLAGEMSGHMFFKERYFGYDDAVYASLRLLEILADSGKPLSALLADLPKSVSTPELRIECPDDMKFIIADKATQYFRQHYDVVDVDGVRVQFPEGWGLIRASNTQPALVLRFEAQSAAKLTEYRALIENKLREFELP